MTDLQTQHLLGTTVVLERAIRNANFFNGRVLTARDMQDEQTANRRQHRQLGRAIGAGIVSGLQVRLLNAGSATTTPVVSVTGGLALNRQGQAIELPSNEVAVALSRTTAPPPSDVKVFADCKPPQSTPDLVGKGIYVLTIAPAAQYLDRAPMVSLNGGGKADGCGDRYAAEGVRFGLIEVTLATLGGISESTRSEIASLLSRSEQNNLSTLERLMARSRLRNLLAYACFGSAALAALWGNAARSAQHESYGIIDALWEANELQCCEVPLALLIWTNAGVRVLDMWAVRRRPHYDEGTLLVPGERRLAEGEAMREQFADHLNWLLGNLSFSQRAAARAIDYFRLLPPAGVLPLASVNGPPGFTYPQWCEGIPHRDNGPRTDELAPFLTGVPFIEGAALPALFHTALSYGPHDLVSSSVADAKRREFIWLFQVRENRQAIIEGVQPAPQPFLVFASGHLPEFGEARFDRARWGYSNFA
jgi:hypothetical protein